MISVKKFFIFFILAMTVSATVVGQQIDGATEVMISGSGYTYTCVVTGSAAANMIRFPCSWLVSGGVVLSQNSSSGPDQDGNLYAIFTATIRFDTPGNGEIIFKRTSSATAYATLNVTIYPLPSTTYTTNYFCGSTTITAQASPGNVNYWQTSSTGTSTTDPSASKTVSGPGATLYLRARWIFGDIWSNVAIITPAVNQPPNGGTIASPPVFFNVGNGQLNLTGNTGTVEKWQSRPVGNSTWNDVASSSGAASINFLGIEGNTEFRALVGGPSCTGISSSIATVTVARPDLGHEIVGEGNPNTVEPNYTYTYTSEFGLLAPVWIVSGGTVTSQSNVGTTYTANIHFTTLGAGYIIFKRDNSSIVFGAKGLTIVAPPAIPTPSINYSCGATTVTSQVTSGVTYYWQTSSTGTSTSDFSASKTLPTPGSTLYLRAKLNNSNNWSGAATISPVVYVTPISGTMLSPSPYYNTASGQLILTGSTGTIEKWQRRPAGGAWVDIASSSGTATINFSGVDESTEFRALLGNGAPCTGISSAVATVTVVQQNFEGIITGTTKLTGSSNSGSLQLVNYTGTVNEWQYSDNGQFWTSIPSSASPTLTISNLAADRYYRVKVTKKNTASYSQAYLVNWYADVTQNLASMNYVQEEVIRVRETNSANIQALTPVQKSTAYTYFDGLSRAVQTVSKKASPTQKDVVGFSVYDALGREQRTYLPYTTIGGNYYSNNLSFQSTFYNGTGKVAGDASPFAEVVFDGSPFNSIIEQGAPGSSWQPGSGHTIRSFQRTNVANEIRTWKTDGTSPGYYAAGTLSVQEITDENGNKVISFIDKRGLLLQKHVQSGAATWLKTINIYDVAGRLKYTVQPEGVKQLASGATISASLLDQFAFQYTYDTRGRVSEKKVPGAAAVYIAYDPLQRPVLVQDGNLRTSNKWAFVKYDLQNRAVLQGIYTNATQTSQAAIQTLLDGLYVASNSAYPAAAYFEERGTTLHGYTNLSFPRVNADNTPIEILNVSFYDGYDFDDADTNDDFSYVNQSLPGENTQTQGPATGLPTGSKRLVLGTSTWLYNYVFYDQYGRAIQTRSNNHLSTVVDNLVTNVYDFEGKVTINKTYHNAGPGKINTITKQFVYDHAGRVKQIFQQNNSDAEVLIAHYNYNELGQVVEKNLHCPSCPKGDFSTVSSNGTYPDVIIKDHYNTGENELIARTQIVLKPGYIPPSGSVITGRIEPSPPTNSDTQSASANFLQSIDYRYTIRGWLKSINNAQLTNDGQGNDDANDYFGMEFLHNTVEAGLNNATYYNGNISAIKWKGAGMASGATDQRSYKYLYDNADRLLTATSQAHTGSAWTKEAGAYNETMTYDDNGNIKTLQRNQRKHLLSGTSASYIPETIDNLTYTYASGNTLSKVDDAIAFVTGQTGFNNAVNNTTEYTYNANGSLTADQNKTIDNITYNVLGKPTEIHFSDSRKIEYTYDAAGNKLTTKNYVVGTATPQTITDYVDVFVYENNNLSFFGAPEGRVAKNGNSLEYQYSIADHQGNTRVVFSSATPAPVAPMATFEGDGGDGSSQYNVDPSKVVTFVGANHTPAGNKVVRMNQTYKIGPSKSVAVFPGDKVDIEVWEYHEGTSGFGTTGTPLNTLITSVASALGGTPGGAGEAALKYNGVNSAINSFGAGGNSGDSRPAAYLNYILFDKGYNVLDAGYQLAPAATFTKQKLSFNTLNIKEPGFVFTYLTYDDDSNNWVYFDDFNVTHTKTNIIQYNEYYPFGLQTNSSWTRESNKNNFLYNEATELNPTSGWYDLAFRNYDPVLGRFHQVDPMASKYGTLSPYNYAFNNPLLFNDPMGNEPPDGIGGGDGQAYQPGRKLRKRLENDGYHFNFNGVNGYNGNNTSMYGGDWSGGYYSGADASEFYRGQNEAAQMLLEQAQAGNISALQQYAQRYGRSYEVWEKWFDSVNEAGTSSEFRYYFLKPINGAAQQGGPEPKRDKYDGHAIGISVDWVLGGGFNFAFGYVVDKEGNGSFFYSGGPSVGFSMGIGGFASDIKAVPGKKFDVSKYEGYGSAWEGTFFGSYSQGGDTENKYKRNYGFNYVEEKGGYGLGVPLGLTYQFSKTVLIK